MKKYISEFIATFALLLAILEAIIMATTSASALLIVSLVAGIAVTVLIYVFRKHSGAHMNPAVSTAMWLDNQLTTKVYFGYFIAQLFGSAAAAGLIAFLHRDDVYVMGMTVPCLTETQAWFLEVALTFILVLAIFRLTDKSKPALGKWLAPVVGLIVFLEIYFAGPYSGASMNPARSFGPALMEGQTQYMWLFFSAPIVGAAIARYIDLIFRAKSTAKAELRSDGE
jgi:aquaporin NIP